jgi:RNase H-fold protein (predicted Holliday junction resolvase)
VKILAVDPGREKCGFAVVDARDGILARGVVPTQTIGRVAKSLAAAHGPRIVVLGKGTAVREVRHQLDALAAPVELVPEANTTLRARRRYFEENPPRGWRRLIPLGLQTPPIPVDDYAAVLIAEDYLHSEHQR